MADEVLLVLSTFPDVATARRIGRQLVEEKCAACANILPQVESIYWWEQKVETAHETLVFFKTTADRYEALQTPCANCILTTCRRLLRCRIEHGLPEYLRWVSENCPG